MKKFFYWSAPRRSTCPIIPVFLPFHGCPAHCVYCAQYTQTGQGPIPFPDILDKVGTVLRARALAGLPPPELAFYGGTFTSMPEEEQRQCLDLAAYAIQRGLICSFRCSTRPDSVDVPALTRLRDAGCSTVELGAQSFADAALTAARRGYGGAAAAAACNLVKQAGLNLGVQLLPGMPGVSPEVFICDVSVALRMGADMLRFYPCLVLAGTELAREWRAGGYRPWDMEVCLASLAQGYRMAMAHKTPVIRMGLAPEAALDGAVLAGPVHPALGERVMARALLMAVRQEADRGRLFALDAPLRCQGYFWGHRGELRATWAALGLGSDEVRFVEGEEVRLYL